MIIWIRSVPVPACLLWTEPGTARKKTLRELIRRERCIELAGEGLRRADILRWKDAAGKMLAETLLNGPLNRIVGTIDYNETDLL